MSNTTHISTPWVTVAFEALSVRFARHVSSGRAAMVRRAKYNQTMNELNRLSDRDLADLGFCRSGIRQIVLNKLSHGEEK